MQISNNTESLVVSMFKNKTKQLFAILILVLTKLNNLKRIIAKESNIIYLLIALINHVHLTIRSDQFWEKKDYSKFPSAIKKYT